MSISVATLSHVTQTDSILTTGCRERRRRERYSRSWRHTPRLWFLSVSGCTTTLWVPANTKTKIFWKYAVHRKVTMAIIYNTTTRADTTVQKSHARLPGQLPWIPMKGGDGSGWDASPKDKSYLNKQQPRKRSPPFLPVIWQWARASVWLCVGVGN